MHLVFIQVSQLVTYIDTAESKVQCYLVWVAAKQCTMQEAGDSKFTLAEDCEHNFNYFHYHNWCVPMFITECS